SIAPAHCGWRRSMKYDQATRDRMTTLVRGVGHERRNASRVHSAARAHRGAISVLATGGGNEAGDDRPRAGAGRGRLVVGSRHRAHDAERRARAGPRRCGHPIGARGGAGAPPGMLTLSPAVRVYLATGATDLRRSIDGLAALVRERFTLDPLSGH